MGAKKKKQRHVRPKGSVTKNEEPSEDEGVELNPNPEPTEAAAVEDGSSEEPSCPHLNSAVPERVKDVLRTGNALWCTDCLLSKDSGGGKRKKGATQRRGKKQQSSAPAVDPEDVWICLTCANPGCGRQTAGHAKQHQERSTKHALVMQQSTQRCWCYVCDKEITLPPRTSNCPYEKVRSIADILRNVATGGSSKKKGRQQQQEEEESVEDQAVTSASEPLSFSRKAPGLRGLRNLGNTCFFNSVMQNLVHNVVLRSSAVRLEPVANYGRLTVALLRFLSEMTRPGASGVFSPGNLFQEIYRKAPRFRGGQQQDSHELFHYLIDGVNDEELKRLNLTPKPLKVVEEEEEGEGEGEEEEEKEAAKTEEKTPETNGLVEEMKKEEAKTEEKEKEKEKKNPETNGTLEETKEEKTPETNGTVEETTKEETTNGGLEASKELQPPISQSLDAPAAPATSVEPTPSSSSSSTSTTSTSPSSTALSLTPAEPPTTDSNEQQQQPPSTAEALEPIEPTGSNNKKEATKEEEKKKEEEEEKLPEESSPPSGSLDERYSLPHHLKGFPRTFVERVFGGVTVSRVTCHTCHTPSETVESSLDFSLPIQNEAVFTYEAESTGRRKGKKKGMTAEKLARAQEFQALIDAATGEKKTTADGSKTDEATTKTENGAASTTGEKSFDARKAEDGSRFLAGPLSVETCLWRYTSPEVLSAENAFGCVHCTRASGAKVTGRTADLVKRRATKQVLLRHVPRLFVLHLKRFQQTARGLSKLSTCVSFTMTLDVTPFCEAGHAPRSPVYRLSGVVEHSGGLSSGHYTAYIRNQEKWYYFSDSHYNAVSATQVLNAEAYLLFYEATDA